jgi:hypothetical protein
MTNEEVMEMMTSMSLHEGGMDNWVKDNAWVNFANFVADAEREACAQMLEAASKTGKIISCTSAAEAIRARGNT